MSGGLETGDIVAIKSLKNGKYLAPCAKCYQIDVGFMKIPVDGSDSVSFFLDDYDIRSTKSAWWVVRIVEGRPAFKNLDNNRYLGHGNDPNTAYAGTVLDQNADLGPAKMMVQDVRAGVQRIKRDGANDFLGVTNSPTLGVFGKIVPTDAKYGARGAFIPNDVTGATELSIVKLDRRSCCMKDATRVSDAVCGAWWGNADMCDSYMPDYCSTHGTDSACACLNNVAFKDPKFGVNPKCIDGSCLKSGYMTANMKSTACPNVISCEVQNNFANSGVSLGSSVTPLQACGGSDRGSPDDPARWAHNGLAVLLAFIFIVLVGVLMIVNVKNIVGGCPGVGNEKMII